ncbi:MAG: beta-galactosidase [Rhodoglobus sp.]|nr:beta-galactosidase [Rhodoglobus sp.]
MTHASSPAFRPRGIRFGAAYYAEYQLTDRIEEDLDLMAAASFSVIRVGESVWSTWEPRNGEFDLDWLQPVLDGAHVRGIGVILGTPTYAVPPWLLKAYPEIAAHRTTGHPLTGGGRQEADYSHPAFLFHAERVVRAVVNRYADHPAVIGFQVDNEPGMELFHNPGAFARFVDRLKNQYGDVDTLNREWGLTYWSHRISDWSELWVRDGNTLPQYDLAWRRYQADLTTEFIELQAKIVREYVREDQFVTTCIAYLRPALEDVDLSANLDITSGNVYYSTQDHLAKGVDLPLGPPPTTTGYWSLYRQADRIFASKQSRFLVTETNAQGIMGSDQNYPPYPGQLALAAFALVSRGAAMVEYWHWHSIHYGTETYWLGVLPHSLRPGRTYREVSELGQSLKAIGDALDDYTPDYDVTLLYSNDSKWAFNFYPPLQNAEGNPDPLSYQRIFDTFYRGIVDAGAQARILHASQLGDDPAAFARTNPVLAVPGFYVATDAELQFLREYALAGGHLVLGIRTGYGDDEARARAAVAPAFLDEAAGISYEEFSNLDAPVKLTASGPLILSDDSRATAWADGVIPSTAEVLVGYDHPALGRFPAITTHECGEGRITYVGTLPNPGLAADLMRHVVPVAIAHPWLRDASEAIAVASGTTPNGARTWFVSNWSPESATVVAPSDLSNLVTGEPRAAGSTIVLDPWGVLVFADAADVPSQGKGNR